MEQASFSLSPMAPLDLLRSLPAVAPTCEHRHICHFHAACQGSYKVFSSITRPICCVARPLAEPCA